MTADDYANKVITALNTIALSANLGAGTLMKIKIAVRDKLIASTPKA